MNLFESIKSEINEFDKAEELEKLHSNKPEDTYEPPFDKAEELEKLHAEDKSTNEELNDDSEVIKGSELQEAEDFDPTEFENFIPNNMRFKHYDTHETNSDVPEGALHWVTQCPFNRDELEQFQKALKEHTNFKEAYVTLRDLSGHDFFHDKGKDVLAAVGKNGYNANPYIRAMLDRWPDFDFNGEPYKSLAERRAENK